MLRPANWNVASVCAQSAMCRSPKWCPVLCTGSDCSPTSAAPPCARRAVASELRSQGSSDAEKIRAEADRERQIIIADAYKQAQTVKGEGDQKASAVYAKAFSENPEFYSFYRSLDAYKAGFSKKSDVLVLEPTSEFFKYLRNPGKGSAR